MYNLCGASSHLMKLTASAMALLSYAAFGQQPTSPAPLSKEDQHFYSTLAADARDAVSVQTTRNVGAMGGDAFDEVRPEGGILVGFDVWLADYGFNRVIGGLRAIFETANGRIRGDSHGTTLGKPNFVIEAKPGYAVVALEARGGDRLDGFKALFWKIHEFDVSMDAEGSYQSDWVGGQGGGKARHPLSSNGSPVLGISGRSGTQIDRLGLIYATGQ